MDCITENLEFLVERTPRLDGIINFMVQEGHFSFEERELVLHPPTMNSKCTEFYALLVRKGQLALSSFLEYLTRNPGLEHVLEVIEQHESRHRPPGPPPPPQQMQKEYRNIWNVPHRNTNFVGREPLFQAINSSFTHREGQPNVIITTCFGLGGAGKTSIALEYAWRYGDRFSCVYWMRADSSARLQGDYIQLGLEKGILSKDEYSFATVESLARKVKSWLENTSRGKLQEWLLIFDNATTYKDVIDQVPVQGGKVLITSRFTEWPQALVNVDVFTSEEAAEYVTGILSKVRIPTPPEEVQEFTQLFDFLPLGIAQATAYVRMSKIQIKDYLELYKSRRAQLLGKEVLHGADALLVTWDITVEAIRKHTPLAAVWLAVAATLDPVDIPHEFLQSFIGWRKKQELYSDVLGALNSYSMLEVNPERRSATMHQLVKDIICLKSDDEVKVKNFMLAFFLLNSSFTFVYAREMEGRQNKDRLRSHIQALQSYMTEYGTLILGSMGRGLRFRARDLYEIHFPSGKSNLKLNASFVVSRLEIMQNFNDLQPENRYKVLHESVWVLGRMFGSKSLQVTATLLETNCAVCGETEMYASIEDICKAVKIVEAELWQNTECSTSLNFKAICLNLVSALWLCGGGLLHTARKERKGMHMIQKAFSLYVKMRQVFRFDQQVEQSIAIINSIDACVGMCTAASRGENENEILETYFGQATPLEVFSLKYQEGKRLHARNSALLRIIKSLVQDPDQMCVLVEALISYWNKDPEKYRKLLPRVLKTCNGGIPLNRAWSCRYTPLMMCAFQHNTEVMKILLESCPSVDVNYADENGTTAFSMAVYQGALEVAQFLAQNGANPVIRDKSLTLLHCALEHGQTEMLNFVLHALEAHFGDDREGFLQEVQTGDSDGDTGLVYAVVNGKIDQVERLLEIEGLNVEQVNLSGECALDLAVDLQIRECLIRYSKRKFIVT